MRSSQRSKLAAVFVFLLIAVVVVGGMAWATASSFQLAKEHVLKDHERNVALAVMEMSSYLGGIMNSETARDYRDYVAFHIRKPAAIWSEDRAEINAARAVLESPLRTSGVPHDWIDLYFQVDSRGRLSSPQVIEAGTVLSAEESRAFGTWDHGVRRTWEWLKSELLAVDLGALVTRACESDRAHPFISGDSESEPVLSFVSGGVTRGHSPDSKASHAYRQRRKSLRDSQVNYLPARACVDADIAERNVRNVAEVEAEGIIDEASEHPAGEVGITVGPITAFWFGVGPEGSRKLAFVRECHKEGDTTHEVFYQGFIGDWSRLKPKLLRQISDRFPDADLEPVPDDADLDYETSKTKMLNLPARLVVPGIPGGASLAAWNRVRGTLITTWIAAGAVLIVAGVGLRNLVALTERRMQFAYAVTHELRTPLTTFRLYSDMLSAGLVPDGSKQEYLETLDRESVRLSSLVEEVLEYARLENHKVKLNPTETDGASLLAGIRETLEKLCSHNGVQARTENAIANGRTLRTDVDLVNRIAGVLLNNACRHARGSRNASVLVRLDDEDGKVHLDVIDSGPGIGRADARTIFKPFRRGRDADAAARGGIGLGLALARSWAALLGGRLELASRHHPQFGGAHFRLTIPVNNPP